MRGALIAAVLLGMAACAPTGTTGPGAAAAPTRSVDYGTIVSMRPVTVQGQEILLRAVASTAGPAVDTAVEFIIREADGQIISVVQTNTANFRPGDRVALQRGDRTRIARPPG
jgi:outer membrane lipoprotein SlyB